MGRKVIVEIDGEIVIIGEVVVVVEEEWLLLSWGLWLYNFIFSREKSEGGKVEGFRCCHVRESGCIFVLVNKKKEIKKWVWFEWQMDGSPNDGMPLLTFPFSYSFCFAQIQFSLTLTLALICDSFDLIWFNSIIFCFFCTYHHLLSNNSSIFSF